MRLLNGKIKENFMLIMLACSLFMVTGVEAQEGGKDEGAATQTLLTATKATTATVEPQSKKETVTYDEKVQRGELLASAFGDVDGDGEEEKIVLMGNKISADSNYYTQLYLLTKNMKTGNVEGVMRPTLGGGYDCSLRLADVNGNGVEDVLIVAPTGGSDGIIEYRIVDFTDNQAHEIFTAEDNLGVTIRGEYLPDYKVRLSFSGDEKEIIMALPSDLGFYAYLGVYDKEGTLLQGYRRPQGQNLSGLIMLDLDSDGAAEVVTTQRIVGLSSEDTLGYVRAVWRYAPGAWQLDSVSFQSLIKASGQDLERGTFIGVGGYKVITQEAVVGRSQVAYPRISNVGKGPQQWKANEKIESFVRTALESVNNGGYLEIDYEVKYGGHNLLSILMLGKKEGTKGSEEILKAFNFDLATGELVPLEKLLGNSKKMWAKVEGITAAQGEKITASTILDYYYDGENFIFIQKNEDKQRLEESKVPKKEVMEFFKDNKIEKQN